MFLNDEYVFHALEMRMKTKRYVGSLCKVPNQDVLHNAMKYFDIWNHEQFLSNPFHVITRELASNMTFETFRIFIELNDLYQPPFTMEEICIIMDVCKKFRYELTHNKGYISITRGDPNDLCTGHRDSSNKKDR